MIPPIPIFKDLGKPAKDLFGKGYNYGFVKLDGKSKTANGIEFATSGSSNMETGKTSGHLETKYKWADYGLTVKEKWTTDNVLSTELSIADQIVNGLNVSFDTSFAPHSGKKSGKIKSGYECEHMNLNFDVDFDFAGPTLHGGAVGYYQGWVLGYQMSFDSAKKKIIQNNFALGHLGDDFTLHAAVIDRTEFMGSIYQKLRPGLEAGATFSWASGTNATNFGVATKYEIDTETTVQAKVDNNALIGLSYSQQVGNGVTLSLSTLVDSKNINAGGHMLGLGLEIKA